MQKLGNMASSWISRWVVCGKITSSCDIIGEMASPGKSTTSDIDHTAMSVSIVISPFPVFILRMVSDVMT